MGLYVRASVQGDIQLSRRLNIVASAVQDWTPAFEKTAEDLIEIFSYDVFETEGEAIGEEWPALTPAYASRKARIAPGAGILEVTGRMREGFSSFSDSTSLTIWNGMEYFKYHQSNAPRTKMPRRVMMKLTADMNAMIVRNFQTYFLEQVGGQL